MECKVKTLGDFIDATSHLDRNMPILACAPYGQDSYFPIVRLVTKIENNNHPMENIKVPYIDIFGDELREKVNKD